jgi:hypothetical protein
MPRPARTSAISAIGALMNITQRHPAYRVRTPPIRIPGAPPAAFAAAQIPYARGTYPAGLRALVGGLLEGRVQ